MKIQGKMFIWLSAFILLVAVAKGSVTRDLTTSSGTSGGAWPRR